MKKREYWFLIVVFIFLSVIAACNKQAAVTSQAKMSESIPNTWSHWVSLPQDSLSGSSTEKIAERLFSLYLNQFTEKSLDESIQLVDFRIEKTSIAEKSSECAKELDVDAIVDVQYSVKPTVFPNSNWVSGSGVALISSHWINEKLATIAVYKDDNNYTFKILGVPMCSGLAIDGSKLH